eukprot:gnl/TRDRNA2_/TRDRNA2_82952_c0_seq1.p1 gnl/TRDRNA2_/TRDRNA2_82952_c0~~gnl/TRDRNA2_/TRDRNA2_82952_c0_seq1.p1  ORF type:complete len:215 (+),score=38.78 gnl/TRDRNA2_/TRDRNA2_82952_c0_seq1:76-645(+)
MWATHRSAALDTIAIDNATFVDLPAFRSFVSSSQAAGYPIAIATFGRKDVATKAMRHALGDDHGVVITSPADFRDPSWAPASAAVEVAAPPYCPEGSAYLGDKNRQLASLAVKFGIPAAQVVLFDDDAHNIHRAKKAGVLAQHTPAGLTAGSLAEVAQVIGLSTLKASGTTHTTVTTAANEEACTAEEA